MSPEEKKKRRSLSDIANNVKSKGRPSDTVRAAAAPKADKKEKTFWTDERVGAIAEGLPVLAGLAFGGAEGGAKGYQASKDIRKRFRQDKMDKQSAKEKANNTTFNREVALEKLDMQQDKAALQAGIMESNLSNQRAQREYQRRSLDLQERRAGSQERRADQQTDIQRAKLQLEKEKASAKDRRSNAPKTLQQRIGKLSGEQRKRLDNVEAAKVALNKVTRALGSGDNTFSLVGDNDFTINARLFAENFGRMQSGAAISEKEEERFRAMLPTFKDSKEVQAKKLKEVAAMLDSRLSKFGISPDELPGYKDEGFDSIINQYSGSGGLGVTPANAAPIKLKKPLDQMTDEELMQELQGN